MLYEIVFKSVTSQVTVYANSSAFTNSVLLYENCVMYFIHFAEYLAIIFLNIETLGFVTRGAFWLVGTGHSVQFKTFN